ncbi:MAG: DUF6513 domain-containing protein [Planctomycetaceae bacterium]
MPSAPSLNGESQGSADHLLFVTGRLAEASLREVLAPISQQKNFTYDIAVPGIQVAALLHVSLLLRRLVIPPKTTRVVLPGWVQGDLNLLTAHFGLSFERGPKDLRDLPEYFGLGKRRTVALDRYSIAIIGEINHATRMPLQDVLAEASSLAASGADLIDIGCVPGESSPRVSEIVRAVRDLNLRVSIDSFDQNEVEQAVQNGAELILSCNHSNYDWVTRLGVEVVAIPDSPADTESLERLVQKLTADRVAFRIDPIIEPIGMGFTASLERYMRARRRFPDVAMMMGIGNVTELTEADSAGMNMLLAAICEELGIQSVLTTQVINWCRTAVAEFDIARRLAHHAVTQQVIPKHLISSLVMLRDPRWTVRTAEQLRALADRLTDSNFRIFAEAGELHLMNRHGHWTGTNPFDLFASAQAVTNSPSNQTHAEIDASHAFYLGYELARAELALQLHKQYEQDVPLRWGLLSNGGGHNRHPDNESAPS